VTIDIQSEIRNKCRNKSVIEVTDEYVIARFDEATPRDDFLDFVNQFELIEFIGSTFQNDAEKILALLISCEYYKENDWIRYHIVIMLLKYKSFFTPLTNIFYALLNNINIIRGNKDMAPASFELAASALARISYVDSLKNYLISYDKGVHSSIYWVAEIANAKLGYQVDIYDIDSRKKLIKSLGLDINFGDFVNIKDSQNITAVAKDCEVKRPRYQKIGNKDFYIFRNFHEIPLKYSIFKIDKGFFSFDLSKQGLPQFYFFSDNGQCILELSRGNSPFIDYQLADASIILENYAFIDDIYTPFNFCHFWLDKMPRVNLFKGLVNNFFIFDKSPYVVELPRDLFSNINLLFASDKRGCYRINNFYLSDVSTTAYYHVLQGGANYAMDYIDSVISAVPDDAKFSNFKKIFISRSDASYRRASNEKELENFFTDLGFKVVVLANLSPTEQVQIFKNTTHIAGIHGAGLTNLVFSKNTNVKVFEIFPPSFGSLAYFMAANAKEFQYFYYVSNALDGLQISYEGYTGEGALFDNLFVDLGDLSKFIAGVDFNG